MCMVIPICTMTGEIVLVDFIITFFFPGFFIHQEMPLGGFCRAIVLVLSMYLRQLGETMQHLGLYCHKYGDSTQLSLLH